MPDSGQLSIHFADAAQRALNWHALYGRNPSSLVTLEGPLLRLLEVPGVHGGVPYLEVGRVWVASEPLCAPEQMTHLLRAFLTLARRCGRLPIVAPASALLAQASQGVPLRRVNMGTTPYVYLPTWQARGNSFKRLRGELNRARRNNVKVQEVHLSASGVRGALASLSSAWLLERRAGTPFAWVFKLAPEQHSGRKRYFMAVDAAGVPSAYLAASPLPARQGWYLEDIIRCPHSAPGTAASLVAAAIETFQREGAAWLTLGGVPLATAPSLSRAQGVSSGLPVSLTGWLRQALTRWYHFDGLMNFKAQFGAHHWEDEYMLLPSYAALPLAAWAGLRLTLPAGLSSLNWKSPAPAPTWEEGVAALSESVSV